MLIVLVCTIGLGVITAIAALVRQFLLSRDTKLNEEAQRKALHSEVEELTKMRTQIHENKPYEAHYRVLGDNKEEIRYIDKQIDHLLFKKLNMIERFALTTVEESQTFIETKQSCQERKQVCDNLKNEIDATIAIYDDELKALQARRNQLWDAHAGYEKQLLAAEKVRNDNINSLYRDHSALLEKVFLRHIISSEAVSKKNTDAGSSSFRTMMSEPFRFLTNFFSGKLSQTSLLQNRVEQNHRKEVEKAEKRLNQLHSEHLAEHEHSQTESESDYTPRYSQ